MARMPPPRGRRGGGGAGQKSGHKILRQSSSMMSLGMQVWAVLCAASDSGTGGEWVCVPGRNRQHRRH